MSLRRVMIVPVLACLLAACQPAQTGERHDRADGAAPHAPVLPVAEPPLDRRTLLLALADAASAAALGEDGPERQRELDGKRFELRLRFGCSGSAEASSAEPRRWTFDEAGGVLRFHVEPDVNGETPLARSIAAAGFEAVEGFWVRRPWLLRAGCPALPPPIAPEPAPASEAVVVEGTEAKPEQAEPPRIAIAQFYTSADPRTHRRDNRPYQATKTLATDEAPSAAGYNLVLSGRLKALPGGRVIACVVPAGETPPSCIISATFDQVAIETPDSREIVAQWATS